DLMRSIRWPDGVLVCSACGARGNDVGEIKTRHMLNCKKCRQQTSLTKGTAFESSKVTLDHWMIVLWVVVNCKNGVSDYELGRAIGRPQKTTWFMRQRIQAALEEGGWIHGFELTAESHG
ncbi:MAG: transposase, partial [Planctomycetaceae bacterium]|nr:transposase [Planctomycetaceae bacterium]